MCMCQQQRRFRGKDEVDVCCKSCRMHALSCYVIASSGLIGSFEWWILILEKLNLCRPDG